MTEILTESFCERCGTRYTFESLAPRQRRLGRIRVLGSGFKNFVMSDDSSLDEAMAAARSDAERDATSQQLDAFHRTFNFCMSCRQYSCGNCWNTVEARCLSCAPLAVTETHDTAFGGIDAARLLRVMAPAADAASPAGPELVGVAEAAAAHTHADDAQIEVPAPELDESPVARSPEPDFEFASDALPIVEAQAEVAPASVEPAPPTEAPDTGLRGLEPGESLDDAIAAYEASLADEPRAAPRGVDVVEQPTWASPPVAAEAELESVAAAEIAPPAEEPPVVIPPVVIPPAASMPKATPGAAPQWPTGPRWPTAIPARQPLPTAPPAADPLTALMARHATEAMWAASSRDVVQPPAATPTIAGVQPCVSCGISLSANARFCRRCGTSQVG